MKLAELLPAVSQLPKHEKLELVRLLSSELHGDIDISPLEPFKTYFLPTPYKTTDAATVLMKSLSAV